MNASRRIGLFSGAAIALASTAAISLTALSVGLVPALADDPPYDPTATSTSSEPAIQAPTDSPEATAPTEATAAAETTSLESTTPTSTTPSTPTSSSPAQTSESTSPEASTTPSSVVNTPSAAVTPSAEVAPSDVAPSAQVDPVVEPERVTAASEADVKMAEAAEPVEPVPTALQQNEIEDLTTFAADRSVLQWQPDWVRQDDYHRPVILNPFPDPIRIAYTSNGDPRTVIIQPRTSALLNFIDDATSFTVMTFNSFDELIGVAVATAFNRKPPPNIPNVQVVVDTPDTKYRPIVVNQVTDLGEDPTVGETKVLLDGATPAWGRWIQNSKGERQFEIHKTQQLPGIDVPKAGPPPGYLLVADDEHLSYTDVFLIVLAALIAAVAVGATVHRVIRRKHAKRREQRERHERSDTRFEARSRPGSTLALSVRETPERGETTHAVRLSTHSHPATLTINEVNDDHTHTA